MLEMWMRHKGLGTCARQLLNEIITDRATAILLHRLNLELPTAPKFLQNVVEKNGL